MLTTYIVRHALEQGIYLCFYIYIYINLSKIELVLIYNEYLAYFNYS